MSLAMTIVADVVPPRERGRYQGLLGAVFGVASIAGPLIGGFIVDNLSWRWVFTINLPIGVAALVVTSIVLQLPKRRVEHRIDWLGRRHCSPAPSPRLLLATTWGGTQYAWGSGRSSGWSRSALLLLVAFVIGRARAPPSRSCRCGCSSDRIFTVPAVISFVVGFAMFGAHHLPAAVHADRRTARPPTASGLTMVLLMMGGMHVDLDRRGSHQPHRPLQVSSRWPARRSPPSACSCSRRWTCTPRA